jgi:hypothetical protein
MRELLERRFWRKSWFEGSEGKLVSVEQGSGRLGCSCCKTVGCGQVLVMQTDAAVEAVGCSC